MTERAKMVFTSADWPQLQENTSTAREERPRHQCLIYDGSPSRSVPFVATLVFAKLAGNFRCLYVNSPAMVAEAASYLLASGVNVDEEVRRGSLVFSSTQNHLVDGKFEPAPMLEMLEGAARQALSEGYRGLFATGDMTWEFGPDRNFDKLLEYEIALEELFRRMPHLSGVCQYHQGTLPVDAVRKGLYAHRGRFINETLSKLNPSYQDAALLAPMPPEAAEAQVKERVTEAADS